LAKTDNSAGMLAADVEPTSDPSKVAAVREALDAAGFSAANVDALVGREALDAARTGDLAGALRATSAGGPLSALVRLFLLGVQVREDVAKPALGALGVAGFAEAGLLTRKAAGLVACLRLAPVAICGAELVIAHDPVGPLGRPDRVLGVNPTAEALAALTIRLPSRRGLDLGCGGGLLALLLAGHADEVVASDVSGRAVRFCAFNAALNGVSNLECRLGDRFEPVEGAQFDIIVSNPPFIISPDRSLLFRDSGLALDEMTRSVVRGSAAHLAPMGFAQVMASWPHVRGEVWHERVHSWVEGLGCDAWVLQIERQSPDDYARRWLSHGGAVDRAAYDRWLDSYERDGIEGFGYGLVTLRRVENRPSWWRHDEVPNVLVGQPAAGLRAGFEAADWLLAHQDDDALLAARLRVAEGARLETWSRAGQGTWQQERAFLRQLAGLPFSGQVDAAVADLVAVCDGSSSLNDVVQGLERPTGGPTRAELLAVVRSLIANSFLVPVSER
jgi:methylase of polypeptide subunit release factors